METIYLDGGRLKNRDEAMEILMQALDLPLWWGYNLDALHDCLTELGRPVRLELCGRADLETTPYGQGLLRVLRDSAAEAPWLELKTD